MHSLVFIVCVWFFFGGGGNEGMECLRGITILIIY